MDDKLKKLILLMEIKNEEKFSSFTESIKQLDKQGFELMSDIKLLFDEISKVESSVDDTELKIQIESLKESIADIQLQKGDKGDKGEDGKNGLNGKDGKDGRDGIDGIDGLNGKDGEKGENGSPDTAEDIVKKINTLESVIERKTIKGLDNLVDQPGLDRALGILDQRTQYLINKTVVQPNLAGYVPTTRTLTINGVTEDLSADRTWSVGTVTDVAALTLGTTGTDLSSTVATGTTTPVITLNVPTASATNRGALSSTDWSTFNAKESALTFSTGLTRATNTITANLSTGISGGQSVIGGTASGNNLTLSSTSNATKGKILFGTSGYDEVNNRLGIGTISPSEKLDVRGNGIFGTTNKVWIIPDYAGSGEIAAGASIGGTGTGGFSIFPNYFGTSGTKFSLGYYNQSVWFSGLELANVSGGFGKLLLMKSGGNVGIGTTTPQATLQVLTTVTDIAGRFSTNQSNRFLIMSGSTHNALVAFGKEGISTLWAIGNEHSTGDTLKITPRGDLQGTASLGILKSNSNIGLSVITPTATLHIRAGTATAGTAPIKLTSGTNLTTPEAGAIEYDGTSFFGTPSSATRYNFLMNNLGLAGGQTVVGGTASGNNLTFSSTSNATKGKILFGTSAYDEVNNRLGIGTTSPVASLDVISPSGGAGTGIRLIQAANNVIQPFSYTSIDFTVPTTGLIGQFFATASNYSNPSVNLAANSTGLISWHTNGQLLLGAAGSNGYISFDTGGYGYSNERMRILANGNVGIGQTSPTAVLHIKAGTATAGTAPLKLTSGTNLTTPENGTFEFDGTNLYFTVGGVRKTVTLV
jgi:hypothetical protein